MTKLTTNEMITELALAILGPETSSREMYVLNRALHGLVQLAKSECRLHTRQLARAARKERTADRPRTQMPQAVANTLH